MVSKEVAIQRSKVNPDIRKVQALEKIGDVLEEIRDELRDMNERQRGGHPGEGGNPLLNM